VVFRFVNDDMRHESGLGRRFADWDFFMRVFQDSWFCKQLRPQDSIIVEWVRRLGAEKGSNLGKVLVLIPKGAKWKDYCLIGFSAFGIGFLAARIWQSVSSRPLFVAILGVLYILCCLGFLWGLRGARKGREKDSGN
jgi:hypothetical protein